MLREVYLADLPHISQIEVNGIIYINLAFAPPESALMPLFLPV